jgi:DMSO/TMAO reductase YedYZ molybdopterin-dependent catalytic subunit
VTTIARLRADIDEDPRHGERTAATLGIALGVSFSICFLTGLYSHFAQNPPPWFTLPAGPAGLYRVTQGLHVVTGIASIPLLLAKLWSVYPKLFRWPPFTSVAHALERISLVPLIAGALFELWSGVANIDLWYPLPFFFPAAHYWVAWITIGALIVHIAAKIGTTRAALARHPDESSIDQSERRRFLGLAGAGSALLVVTTVGMTVEPLQKLALLSPRRPSIGPQGFPVNKAAVEAGVVAAATSPDYRLEIVRDGVVARAFSLDELRTMTQTDAELPIACVEGWSASVRWRGVRLRDVLDLIGASTDSNVTVRSLEGVGLYAQSDINPTQARAADTLLALEAEGSPLDLDHGYPVRLIAPNRPGVMQTKWLSRIEIA